MWQRWILGFLEVRGWDSSSDKFDFIVEALKVTFSIN